MTPPVSPVETGPPDEIYVCFMKDWNSWHIHNWTTKATDNYHKFVLAGNKLLDTIDAHDSEKEPLSSNHPDVHAFSSLLDKMPPTDMQADVNGELERLRAALKAHEVQWNRLQDAIAGMEKTMEAHGIDHFKWQPMTFEETLKGMRREQN